VIRGRIRVIRYISFERRGSGRRRRIEELTSKQKKIPSGWPTDIDALSNQLYQYTLSVGNSFASAGLSPAIISIGNEITSGLLFPTGSTSSSYYNIARLLYSASSGIRNSSLGAKPKILIHLDDGWNWSVQKHFYTAVLAQGPLTLSDFDIMGVSYYPFYSSSATLAALKSTLASMASTWGKSLVVAETNWPSSCPSPTYAFPSDANNIAFSADGQEIWIKDVAAIVAATKGGVGLFYWEPAWIQNAGLGSSCEWNLMVESDGTAMSSLAVFGSI
jgi:arabinogalactan endo-1,4-beta-galactosidase